MNRLTKPLTVFLALSASAVLVACGGVPSNSVATVADTPITQADFNHWLTIASKSTSQQTPGAVVVVPDAPNFTNCIAQKRKAAGAPSAANPAKTDAQYKADCQALFDQQKGQVMQLLVTSQWIQGQAARMGITVSDAEVKAQFEKTKKGAFPNEAAYQKFLAQSGETEQDILFRIKVDALSAKIRDAALKGADQVSDADARAYFASHKQQFGQPEKRDLLIIRTATQAQALAAKAAVSGGQDWAAVVKKYSNDPQTKSTGGSLKGAVKGQDDPALDKAAFVAKTNTVIGPVQGALGWYVAKVVKVTGGSTQSFDAAKPQIVQVLKSQQQQAALNNFVKDFQKQWKSLTDCAKIYTMELCKNAPKAAAAAGGASGATVQQTPATSGG